VTSEPQHLKLTENNRLHADGWTLAIATADEIDQLMDWFPDKRALTIWGGPSFRFPYSRETFHEDVRWNDLASFCLRDPGGNVVAFGQAYERVGRINLARLVVHADSRGQGVGRKLISLIMAAARGMFDLTEFSLFVYRDNVPAYECYKSMGFIVREYPEELSLGESIHYLTRPVAYQE
jgi:ribosomal protein S18 acetylase RimI-like enzyme